MMHDARVAGSIAIGDFNVARIGFGARWLAARPIWPDRPGDAAPVLRRAVELGIGLIDTANIYGAGVNEMQIAQALRPYPSDLLIATKGGMAPREPSGALGVDCHPARLRQRCDESLERLGVDHIDLYQLHLPDPKIPWPEQVGALRDLRDTGKIRHAGICNVSLQQVIEAQAIVPISSVQNTYGLHDRSNEDVLQHCATVGIPFLVHRPFDGGKVLQSRLDAHAASLGVSASQLVLARLLRLAPNVVPLPGTSRIPHLEENVDAGSLQLSDDDLRIVD